MFNEHDFTRKIKEYMRKNLERGVYLKHSEQFTVGNPDASLTVTGLTTWLEYKFCAENEGILERIETDRVQLSTCAKLATHGRCLYVVAKDKQIYYLHPVWCYKRITGGTLTDVPPAKCSSLSDLIKVVCRQQYPGYISDAGVDVIHQLAEGRW